MEENKQATWNRDNNENSLQLADIWAMIWNNRLWYVISVVLCLLFAVFYIYKTPKTYVRTSKVIIDEGAQNAALRELTSFSTSSRRSGTNVYNEIQALNSPDLMERVVSRLGYETKYVEKQTLRERELFTNTPVTLILLGDNPPSSFSFDLSRHGDSSFVMNNFKVGAEDVKRTKVTGSFKDTLSTPVGQLMLLPTSYLRRWNNDIHVMWASAMYRAKGFRSNFGVSLSGRESSVVSLTMEDYFPNRAANIINTIVDVYNEDWVANKNRSATNTSQFINERLNVIEQELGGVEEDLKEYKEKNRITDIQNISHTYMSESSAYASKVFRSYQ